MIPEANVITCRGAVLWEEGKPMTIETITVDPPKEKEIRVKNIAAGICASDAHFLWNQETDLKVDFKGLPVVLGHEGAAVVESVGEGINSVSVGDKVVPLFIPNCSSCTLCHNPKTNRCLDASFDTTLYARDGTTRLKIGGKPLLSFCGTNTFAEYSVLRESQICKVNPKLDLKTAAIIGCAVGTGFATAEKLAQVHPGSICCIWGLGAIGLSTCLACKMSGAAMVIGVDLNSRKEKLALKFGCDQFINPRDLDRPLAEYLQSLGGVDYAFDCIGNIEVLRTGLRSLSPWGTLTAIGLGPSGKTLEVNVGSLLGGQRLLGGYFANQKSRKTIEELTERFVSGSLPIEGLITHRISLDEINYGFDLMRDGKSVRTVIEY